MIKLIIFDVWKTLAERGPKGYSSTLEMKKKFELEQTQKEIAKIFEKIIQTKRWETEYDAYKELLKELKIDATRANIMQAIAIRGKAEINIVLYDFVIPLLKQLRKKKIKIGLITNSSIFIKEILERDTGLLKYIDYPIFSYELGTIKPDLRLYLEMQRIFKISNPKEIIMIGDNIFDDIYPAKELGINTIHFTGDYEKLKKELKKYKVDVE